MWQRVWPNYLSFTPFDPTLIHSGSDDRRVDALVEKCAALTSHGLLDMGSGGTVQQQYLDVIQYFKRKWTALQDDVPVVEDVISMWMSYPHWERCSELKQVLDLVITITINGNYEVDFKDEASTALDADTLLSSLHLVRSWFTHSFVGKTRKNLRGLLRVAETTDMLVSRLSDAVRGKPWDQLLKVGLDQTLTRCMSVLTNDIGSAVTPMVDDYRSAVLAQLNVKEVVATSPIRPSTSPKAKRFIGTSKGKGASTQANVQIPIGSKAVSTGGKSIKRVDVNPILNQRGRALVLADIVGEERVESRGVPRPWFCRAVQAARYCGVRKHQQQNERLSGPLPNLPTRASGFYFVLKDKLESLFIRKTLWCGSKAPQFVGCFICYYSRL